MTAAMPYSVSLESGLQERVPAARITNNFFTMLGIRPQLGRGFLPGDFPNLFTDKPTTAIISHGFWLRRFGGSASALGFTLPISTRGTPSEVRIVGILPPESSALDALFPNEGGPPDVWLPLTLDEKEDNRYLKVIARRRDGVSLGQAQSEIDIISRHLLAKRPRKNETWTAQVRDLREVVVGNYKLSLLIMAFAVGLVLLIACANIANLMLARGAARLREMATRKAMGAANGRLIRQLATESLLLSLCAGALGFVLSIATIPTIVAFAPAQIPRISEAGINLTVFAFCLMIAIATGLLCSLAPALGVAKLNLSSTLKDGGTSSRGSRGFLSRGLVILEIAASLVLLIGGTLLSKGFARSQLLSLGFQPDHVLTVAMEPIVRPHPTRPDALVVRPYGDSVPQLQAIPGVVAIGSSGFIPPNAARSQCSTDTLDSETTCASTTFSHEYFKALQIPLVAGRLFASQDTDSRSVTVINETAARMMWPSQSAIGKRIALQKPHWMTVIGVVKDVPNAGLREPIRPHIYQPPSSWGNLVGTLLIRYTGDLSAISKSVREVIQSGEPNAKIGRMTTMEQLLDKETAPLRFNTLIMTAFAILAFVLAASGVYSLMSYTVSLRMREVSIRMALGATRNQIIATIVRSGALLTTIGIALGIAGAFGTTRYLASMLFQVTPLDPASFAVATALLIAAALTACYIPARRAASADVVEILRQD